MQANNQVTEMQAPLLDVDQTPITESSAETEVSLEEDKPATWLMMAFLLLMQFGTCFFCLDKPNFNVPVIVLTIALFFLMGWLYHQTSQEVNTQWTAVLLLPEIVVNIVLFVVLFGHPEWGVTVLLWGAIVLSAMVLCATAPFLFSRGQPEQVEEKEEEQTSGLAECQIV